MLCKIIGNHSVGKICKLCKDKLLYNLGTLMKKYWMQAQLQCPVTIEERGINFLKPVNKFKGWMSQGRITLMILCF